MTQEQKAKAYDEAIKRANAAYKDEDKHLKATLERIFPELKGYESEDERIRKYFIAKFKKMLEEDNLQPLGTVDASNLLYWLNKQGEPLEINPTEFDIRLQTLIGKFSSLPKEELASSLSFYLNVVQNDGTYVSKEKQDEQKPADKIEPKFHEGDWITNGDYTWKIVEVKPLDYILQSQDGNIVDDTISHVDEQFHSFTIEDVKDGDVLVCNKEILLFKSYSVQSRISLYCWYNGQTNNFHSKEVDNTLITTRNKICPATKGEREIFFAKMKEAGYIFDFKKKELQKAKQNHDWNEGAMKRGEQNPAKWSEEDEDYIDDLIKHFSQNESLKNTKEDIVIWLKSLKNKMQQN